MMNPRYDDTGDIVDEPGPWLTHPPGFLESLVAAKQSFTDTEENFPAPRCARIKTRLPWPTPLLM